MSDDRKFQVDLKLDKYALDKCALEQPELYAHWATQWADAVNDRDRLKDKLSLVRSECDSDVRRNSREYGWASDKAPTEAWVASVVAGHPDYVDANNNYLTSCHDVNIMSIAKDAFEQRRKMIEVLAQLYMSSYFSGNKDFDKTYKKVIEETSVIEQSNGLNSNPRLARRKLANAESNSGS